MRAFVAAALAAVALSGCTGPTATPAPVAPPAPPAFTLAAPWWDVGDAYTVRMERLGSPPATWRMVNFWNDTATSHFWLGVSDRDQAIDMALFDTNPFLGRIHHHILTPHERGMHAAMYNFPLEDDKRWTGSFFDRNWSFHATKSVLDTPVGKDVGVRIEGETNERGGARITYDYSPRVKWFTELQEHDAAGRVILSATLEGYEHGVPGTYLFLRGLDFYEGPQLSGTREEPFTISEPVDSLAFYAQARAVGPVEIQLVDPSGALRHRQTAAPGSALTFLKEVQPVPMGEWKVRYVSAGAIEGSVLATGFLETSRSV